MPARFLRRTPKAAELPVRRLFVAKQDMAAGIGFPLGLALHQKVDTARQHGDFRLLAGDDIRQILNRAGEIGDMFFQFPHAGEIRRRGGAGQWRNPGLAVRRRC